MVFWDQIIIRVYSILTLVGNIILILYLLDSAAGRFTGGKFLGALWRHFDKRAIEYVFLVSLLATGGSLIFSEVLNFSPCILCWFQRIFMYPVVLLSGLALLKKDKKVLFYIAAMSLFGIFLAGYHYYGQVNENTILPCSVIGYSASCSDSFFLEFGYITIPFMALTAFLLIFAAWYNSRS